MMKSLLETAMKGVPAGNAEQVDQKEVGMEQRRQ
jgi:hypothetical protein